MAVVFAAVLGVVLHSLFAYALMDRWSWRIPFFIGSLIVPLIFLIGRSLEET